MTVTNDEPSYYASRCHASGSLHSLERNEFPMAETAFAPEITDLGDKIAKLTIVQAVQLKDYLKETYKIEPAAGGAVVMAGPGGGGGGGGAAPAAEVKTEF